MRLAATQRRLECTRDKVTPWSDVTEMVAAVSLRCEDDALRAALPEDAPTIAEI